MSREGRLDELQEKTQQLLQGSLKHVRVAALAAALVPLASVAVSRAVVSAQGSGGTPVCVASNAAFGLNSAANFTVLGKSFADVDFGSAATRVTGNVGLGPHDTGSLIKATIDGALFLDPTATPDIHGDLVVTGGTVIADLSAPVNDADTANAANAAAPATQGAVTVADVPSTTITLANPSGPNVVPVTSVSTHGMITIVGDFSATVVFNVAGGFTCNGCSMVLASATPGGMPIPAQNILWNFIGGGGDVTISKPIGAAQGIFLAPHRNILLDKATLTGAVMGAENGLRLLVHSGAQLMCPKQ